MRLADNLVPEINEWRRRRKALIISHFYQPPEIQDIADFVGDSLELARKTAQTSAEVIVTCGVDFMAESAAILSPEKIVLLPDRQATCPMAEMVTASQLRSAKEEMDHPVIVSYVNTSAAVKAESDICCTSANAARVLKTISPDQQILFVPDRNLGEYAAMQAERQLHLWPGYCKVHDAVRASEVLKGKDKHPEALVLVHPECRPEVTALADLVASTAGMLRFIAETDHSSFIIGTEKGLLHQMQTRHPEKKFYLASESLWCENMKLTSLEKIHNALQTLTPRVTVPEEIRAKAYRALEKMLDV